MTTAGFGTVSFLYTRLLFHWTTSNYSEFATADGLISVLGISLLSFAGLNALKLRDTTAGVVATSSLVAGSLTWAFALHGWMIYLGETRNLYLHLVQIHMKILFSFQGV
jgi:hypothetical protein